MVMNAFHQGDIGGKGTWKRQMMAGKIASSISQIKLVEDTAGMILRQLGPVVKPKRLALNGKTAKICPIKQLGSREFFCLEIKVAAGNGSRGVEHPAKHLAQIRNILGDGEKWIVENISRLDRIVETMKDKPVREGNAEESRRRVMDIAPETIIDVVRTGYVSVISPGDNINTI